MNPHELQQMFGSTPDSFKRRVEQTLRQPEKEAARPRSLRVALVTAIVLALTIAVAAAAFTSKVADVYGWAYGDNKREELMNGKIAQEANSAQMGHPQVGSAKEASKASFTGIV